MTAGCFSFRLFSRAGRSLLISPPRQWLVPAPSFLSTPFSLSQSVPRLFLTSFHPPSLTVTVSPPLPSLFSFVRYLPALWLVRIVSYVSEARCLGALAGRGEAGASGRRVTCVWHGMALSLCV